jgi:hypothetical protein
MIQMSIACLIVFAIITLCIGLEETIRLMRLKEVEYAEELLSAVLWALIVTAALNGLVYAILGPITLY